MEMSTVVTLPMRHSLLFQLFESQSTRKIAFRMQEELERLQTDLVLAVRGEGAWELRRASRFSK
jgi:hypothetical protein